MFIKATELFFHKYQTVFDKEKTAKAYGYWKPYRNCESFFRLAKQATTSDLESGKVYAALLRCIGSSDKQQYKQLLQKVCVCSMFNLSEDYYISQYKKLCDEIGCQDLSCMQNCAIEMLICVLLSLGMFSAALQLREKYEEKILNSGNAIQKYAVFFQNGQFENAYQLLKESPIFRIQRRLFPNHYASIERSLLPILFPEKADNSSPFAQYLAGKSIFIIGPSDNNASVVIPADNHVVIRYAYMGDKKVGGKYKDIPTDVSYYNGAHATSVASMEAPEFLSNLKFAVLKYKLQTRFWETQGETVKVRYANRAPYTMQHGVSPNMLQIVLADLLTFGRQDLTVLDNNLYLNRHYTKGYASEQVQKKMDDFAFANQFAKHDVFCNFKFTKALFNREFFSADSRLTEILQMTCAQFAKAMEDEYGHLKNLRRQEKTLEAEG